MYLKGVKCVFLGIKCVFFCENGIFLGVKKGVYIW